MNLHCIAKEFNISEATIRNWIKLGLVNKNFNKQQIKSLEPFSYFLKKSLNLQRNKFLKLNYNL
jgi:hypothetical protein